MKLIIPNRETTIELGHCLGEAIKRQMIICLSGPLGAGKTTFVQGLAAGLAVDEIVNSPTFTMMNEYHSGRIPLYHFDLYRLSEKGVEQESLKEYILFEFEELLETASVIVIEWAELLFGGSQLRTRDLGVDHLDVLISYTHVPEGDSTKGAEQAETRLFSFVAKGDNTLRWVKNVSDKFQEFFIYS